jgi:signal transduction histidine kinase
MKKLLLLSAFLIFACTDDEGNPCVYQPTLTTETVTDITETLATLNGTIDIYSQNCDTVENILQGFVYSTSSEPTINDDIVNVNGTSITESLTNLEPNTTYYVRVFLVRPLIGVFYGNEVFFVTEEGMEVQKVENNAWSKELGWHSQCKLQNLVNANLPLSEADVLESWFVSAVNDEAQDFAWVLYMNFALSGNKLGWLAFLSKKVSVDEGIFPILATARDGLNSGIRRRLTDVNILERNVQLQDSVNNLESAKRQLIQSEKMASLGQLAAGVAHEINNPVAFVRSNMEVFKDYLHNYKNLHYNIKTELTTHKTLDMKSFTALCEKADLAYIDEDSTALLTSNIEGLNRVRDIV